MKKSTSALKKIQNSEYFPLCILILISAISRFSFVLKGFGEPDAASIAVSSIDFITHGANGLLTNLYFIDIVPLYVIYIKMFMKLLNGNYKYILTIMNYTNAVFGTLIIIPVYFFVRRLFNNTSVAFYTILTFSFTPSVFQSSIYGFPHFLALFFFITSLYFFLIWLDDAKYSWLILSCITSAASILLKSDFIMGSGAYFGLLYLRKVKEKEKIASSFLIIIVSFISLLLVRNWMGIDKGYTTSVPDFLKLIETFSGLSFSRGASEIFRMQVFPILYATGVSSFLMASIAFIFYLIKRKFDILIFIFAWTALPTVFWLLIHGNSARHNMISVLPFIMIIFIFLYDKAPRLMAFFSIAIILGNYLIPYPSLSTGAPSSELIKSQFSLNSQAKKIHLVAKEIANLEGDKIIIAPSGFIPYLYYEIFSIVPKYKLIKLEIGNPCYMLKDGDKKCIICNFIYDDAIKDVITKYHLEKVTIIIPVSYKLSLTTLKVKEIKMYGYDQLDGSMKLL